MPINDTSFRKNNPETVASLMEFLHPNFHIASRHEHAKPPSCP